jgi:hypothetical protein
VVLAEDRDIEQTNFDLNFNDVVVVASLVIVEIHRFDEFLDVTGDVGQNAEYFGEVFIAEVDQFVTAPGFVEFDYFFEVRDEEFIVIDVPYRVLILKGFLEALQRSGEGIAVFSCILI